MNWSSASPPCTTAWRVAQDISTSNDYNAQALQKVRGGSIGDAFATFRGAQFKNFTEAGIYTELKGSKAAANYQPGLLAAGQSGESQLGLPYQVVFPMPHGQRRPVR